MEQLSTAEKRHIRIATEGVLLGTLIANGFTMGLAIVSDATFNGPFALVETRQSHLVG